MQTKQFNTDDVMSVVTDRLMPSGFDGLHGILSWMSGEDVYTHQIPRIGTEAQATLLDVYPEFQDAINESDQVNRENVHEWSTRWRKRYGDVIEVPKMTADQHERIDWKSEAAEHFPPNNILEIRMKRD